jgi:hypothetical protein
MDKIEPIVIPININFDDIDKYYVKDPETIFVHLSKDEAKMLDTMIGGVPQLNEMGVRDYSALSEVIAKPEVRDIFKNIYTDLKRNGSLRPSLSEAYELSHRPEGKFHPMPGDKNPIVEDQAEEGIKGDSLLVLLPKDFIIFWSILRGALVINPKTELLMFGFWESLGNGFRKVVKFVAAPVRGAFNMVGKAFGKKNLGDEVIRIGATIAGAYFGGPMGAALGASLGHMATGNSFEHSLVHGLKGYGYASGAKALAGSIGYSLPGAMATTQAPIVYGGKAAAEHAARQAAAGAAGNAAANTAANTAAQAAPSFIDKLSAMPGKALDFVTSGPGIAMAAAVPLLMSGHKKNKRDIEKDNAKNSALWESEKEKAGVNAKLRDPINKYDDLNTDDISGKFTGKYIDTQHVYKGGGGIKRQNKAFGGLLQLLKDNPELWGLLRKHKLFRPHKKEESKMIEAIPLAPLFRQGVNHYAENDFSIDPSVPHPYQHAVLKKGGKVKSKPKAVDLVNISVAHEGSGKGQADNIKFDPPANGYYWDASTTSMLGDGNTSAGLKILKNFERNILRNYKGPKINSMIEKVPAAVSDGEFLQSPLTVTIIGAGSNKKGAKILDMVRENIRRHKSKNGGGLPPKAKSLESYFPKKMKG